MYSDQRPGTSDQRPGGAMSLSFSRVVASKHSYKQQEASEYPHYTSALPTPETWNLYHPRAVCYVLWNLFESSM
jgi:hypothetical protein